MRECEEAFTGELYARGVAWAENGVGVTWRENTGGAATGVDGADHGAEFAPAAYARVRGDGSTNSGVDGNDSSPPSPPAAAVARISATARAVNAAGRGGGGGSI